MKENKYRGKRSYDKQWVYGSLLIDCDGDFHIIESKVVEKDGHHIQIDSDFPMFFDNDTVGQFTGLHDKNGVEIYDGDIIKNTIGKLEKVVFVNGSFQCASIEFPNANLYLLDTYTSYIKVIGNIHESEDK